jgi:protein-S-isoprenylcysteine O-methyltransferase Ste14
LQLIAIPFFLVSGILIMARKSKSHEIKAAGGHTLFIGGFLAGIMNPMLFTFWFMVTNFLVTGNFISLDSLANSTAFIAGTAFGALLLLILFARLTQKHRRFLEQRLSGNLNKLVGIIFIFLAIVQFIKWIQ